MSAGPARMAAAIDVDLPYPRTLDMKTQEAFGACARLEMTCEKR
jgi:NitT/TauT family transport system ATP-binding protein